MALPEYQQQRGTLDSGPSPGLRGITAPSGPASADLTAGTKVMSAFGEELSKVGVKLGEARDQTEATTASSEFTKRLETLQGQYSTNPDYKTALESFQKDRNALQMELSQNISNDALRQKTLLEWDRAGVIAANRVNMAALRAEKNANDDAIGVQSKAALKTYSEAQSRPEQQAATSAFTSTVKGAVSGGWIDHAAAAAMVAEFGVQANVADATNLIKADPVVAQHALLEKDQFPALNGDLREGFVRTAQDVLTAQERAADIEPSAQALTLFAQGALTPTWLIGQADALPYPTQRLLSDAITAPPAAKTDPNLAWQLLARGNSSTEEAVALGADGRASGKITDAMMQQLIATSAQAEKARAEVPWLSQVRGGMIESLKPTELQHPESGVQQLGAVSEFDKYVADNPNASEFEARAEASKIARVARSKAAFAERFAIEVPRYAGVGPGGLTRDKLIEAAARTMQAHDSAYLTDDELVEQVDLMRGWDDILNREGEDK